MTKRGLYYATADFAQMIKNNSFRQNITDGKHFPLQELEMEKRIPFEVSVDPFYSESNMEHLRRGVEALNAGKGVEHDIIEEDE